MIVSDSEKRWLVIGIAINKVVAPVLRDVIKQGMDTHYTNLDTYCSGLTTPCTLATLTYHQFHANPNLRRLKFQNINNNLINHGNHTSLYNYTVNSPVDLARLYLRDKHLAEFSAFDESLDMTAILQLLQVNNYHPAAIFSVAIQTSADAVRKDVRNKWGHFDVTEWTEAFFNDCFSKLETLVRSLGLTGGKEKNTLDQLSDWQGKGCQLCMGHAVDNDLLSLAKTEINDIIKDLSLQSAQLFQVQQTAAVLQERLCDEEHTRTEELKFTLERLTAIEKTIGEELLRRVQGMEEGITATNTKMKQLEEKATKTEYKVDQLGQGLKDRMNQLELKVENEKLVKQGTPTDDELEELGNEIAEKWMKLGRRLGFNEPKLQDIEQNHRQLCEKGYHMLMHWKQENGSAATYQNLNVALQHKLVQRKDLAEQICYRPDLLPGDTFDVKICRQKLAEHYRRTAKVPTSVWSKTLAVNIHQIYTRLSWVKEEQTPAGSSRADLNHYTDMFTENKNGLPSNRILVQGQTGIGKSTFVKKLAMDWAELDENRLTDEQRAILKKFELAVIIDLKKVSKDQSLRDVISASHIFAEEDTAMKDGLLSYITQNQDKVLLVFDGYDEYHCAQNSEIFEIFRGTKLRNCCVLITTRISKADELKESQDVHAEITGFSEEDRKAFMIRMLGSETQAKALGDHLVKRGVKDLVRVPLLLLFFCTLWKKGKQQNFPDSKTKLYVAIIQYVLDHNEGKCCSSNFRKVEDFTEILAEIGKVALECLLNDDHVFEYDQLCAAILCEESRIMGLLQVSDYAENIRPAGMVSFIHKSIQEFLAAWYITYRCVLKGNLGEINDRARTLDKCRSLENVFRFICGLSDGGAEKVFEHLTSVRVSDSELDLSKTIPDEQRETDVALSRVTKKQRRFINLVYNSFDEVESKTELLRHCLNCTEGIIFLWEYGRSISDIVPDRKILNEVSIRGVVFYPCWGRYKMTVLCESLEFLNCLHIPLKATENLAAVSAEELLKKFESVKCTRFCGLSCILHFHSGQTLFYFTELEFRCDDHAKLFTENFAPSHSASLCPTSSSLKFLRFLHLGSDSKEPTMRSFSTIIRDCKSFERFVMVVLNDGALECLEQIPNPLTCRLSLGDDTFSNSLKSSGVLKLASLLPRFNNLIEFSFSLQNGCAEAENKLVCCITHKTLQKLNLWNLRMTPAIAAALGRSLPEMSSLKELKLVGRVVGVWSTVQVEDMKALFGGFNKVFPALETFRFAGFSFRGGFAQLTERFHFFPSLRKVDLSCSNLDERDLRGFVCSLKSIPNMRILDLRGNPLGFENRVKSIVKQALPQVDLEY